MEIIKEILFEGGNDSEDILSQLLSSGYYQDYELKINRFLDSDRTIDLERLELAIILLIEYLEKSEKIEDEIYINVGNLREYFYARKIDVTNELDRVIEESSFILGFTQAVADENKIDRKVIIRFTNV